MAYFQCCSVDESLGDRQGKIVTSQQVVVLWVFFPATAWPFVYFFAFGCFPCSGRFPQLSWGLCAGERHEALNRRRCHLQTRRSHRCRRSCHLRAAQLSTHQPVAQETLEVTTPNTSGFVPERRGTGTDKQHAQGTGSCFTSLMADPLMSTNTWDGCLQPSAVV